MLAYKMANIVCAETVVTTNTDHQPIVSMRALEIVKKYAVVPGQLMCTALRTIVVS